MANTTIKISQLPSIGNALTASTILPVVSLTGTATTNKVAVGNIANFTLIQAGNTLPPASLATIAYSVANAAQPNITSVGTLSSLAVTGNISAGNVSATTFTGALSGAATTAGTVTTAAQPNITSVGTLNINTLKISGGTNGYVMQTDGAGNLTWTAQTGGGGNTSPAGSNTQIQFNNEGEFGANTNLRWDTTTQTLFAPNINANIVSSSSNLFVNGWEFTNGGRLIWPSVSGTSFYIDTNGDNEFEIKSLSNVVISSDITNVNSRFTFASNGVFYAPSNVELQGTRLSIGPDAANFVLESPTVVIGATSNVFVQAALINQNANGSSDWVAYGAEGDDTGGWADFGFTGYNFNDANYTITGPGDGYMFVQGYANGQGNASLVLSTGDQGNVKDIIFATGGFASENEFGRISDANNSLEINRANASITFPDGTIQTTAYTGGANTGNVTFDDVTVQGDNQLNLSAGPDYTANLAYLQVRAGDVASHIHLDTGNNEAYDLIVGNDQKFVQVSSTGNIIMSSYDSANALTYTMTLDNTGNLNLSDGNSIIRSLANSSLDPLYPNVSTMVLTPDSTLVGQSLVLDPTAPGHIHLRAPGPVIDQPFANIFLGGEESSFEVGYYNGAAPNVFVHSGNNTWTFDTAGNLNLPNLGDINADGGGITQSINNDLSIVVQDEEDDGWSLYNIITDGIGNNLSQTTLDSSSFTINTDMTGGDYRWQFEGNTLQVSNNSTIRGFDSNVVVQSMYSGTSATASLQSVSNVNDPNIFTTIDATTTGANIKIYNGGSNSGVEYAWQFDNDGNLTVPGDTTVSTANATGGAAGKNISVVAGAADQSDYYTTAGGNVNIAGGLGAGNDGGGGGVGGSVNISAGLSADPVGNAGNVVINAGGTSYTFSELDLNVSTNPPASPAPSLNGFGLVSAPIFTNGNSNVTIQANLNLWNFDSTGNLIIPGSSGGFIKTVANASIGIAAVDNGTNNPAQLLSMTDAGAATSIISAYATNATIQTNATGTLNTWQFDSAGNLTLPGNTVAIKLANGSAAFGNIATINLNGNSQTTLLGNGSFGWSPIIIQDEDVNILLNTLALNFKGNVVTTTGNSSNGVATVTINAINGMVIQEEGVNVVTSNAINIVGSGITASNIGNIATITLNSNSSNSANSIVLRDTNGNIAGGNISATGTLTSTGKIGYASGSTVTQATNRGTSVTIDALAGTIVTVSASMVAGFIDTFGVSNNQVDPNNDIVLVQIVSPNFGMYNVIAQPSAIINGFNNGFFVNIQNISGGPSSNEAITIRFMVIKAPNA